MPTQTISLQKRAVAFLSALLLAISMACVAPLSALAADSSGFVGTIKATNQAATVAVGDTIDMSASTDSGYQFKITVETEGDYHVDYAITSTSDGGAATINKHSGVLTASAAGEVTVTAYLLDCAQGQSSYNPCYDENVIATATKTVEITESTGSYGYQGNNLQIKMTSFSPQLVSYSDGVYTNSLTGVTASDGCYSFAITQSYGTGSNFDDFLENNMGQVNLYRGQNATPVYSLGDGSLELVGTSQSNDVTVQIPDGLSAGNYTLTFESGYAAGNGKTLGETVSFTFTIS